MPGVFYFPLIGTPTAEGNLLSFFIAGTDTPLDVWSDELLSVPWSQPIALNAIGESDGPIYVSTSPAMKVVYTNADGAAIPGYPVDFVSPSTIINVTTTTITTLTNAQIKALPTTPITVVAAPGSGLRTKFLGATITVAIPTTAYSNINTTLATLQIQTASGNWVSLGVVNRSAASPALTQVSNLLGNTGTLLMDLGTYAGAQSTTPLGYVIPWGADTVSGNYDNAALQIAMDNNGSGDLTVGDVLNSMTVTVYHATESV